MFSPAALTELLIRPVVSTLDLVPFVDELLRSDPRVPTEPAVTGSVGEAVVPPPRIETLSPVRGLLGDIVTATLSPALFVPIKIGSVVGTFSDPAWYLHKKLWGVTYDKVGKFHDADRIKIEVCGERDYVYRMTDPQMVFERHNGERVTAGTMRTDGGSVPRVCWSIPGFNPWAFLPAFLVHDWHFTQHHCDAAFDKTFEEVNQILAEGIYTIMATGMAPADWRVLVAVHAAVSSFVGRGVWSRNWSPDQCKATLNP